MTLSTVIGLASLACRRVWSDVGGAKMGGEA